MLESNERRPYTPEESRVCEYLQKVTKNQVGCGDDPIGFLISSHETLMIARKPEMDAAMSGRCFECGGELTVACLACLTSSN
jgi:hypothetical protein